MPRFPLIPARPLDRCRTACVLALSLGALGSGCRTNSTVVVTSVPGTATATPPGPGDPAVPVPVTINGWRVESREHVDLWLHGFAMLQGDSSLVPYFRPGYQTELSELRRRRGASTLLDANALVLRSRLGLNPNLTSAQFIALYFASWSDLRTGCDRFLRADGDVRAAQSNESMRMYATLATYFPTASDREWLRVFLAALEDERTKFHRDYWSQQQQARAGVRSRFAAEWSAKYAAAFGRFMNASSQRQGSIVLSLALGGEGRSLNLGGRDNFITVGLPAATSETHQILYTLAHEVVGTLATGVVRDHASAADDRSGESARWTTLAPVRAGVSLLERIAPELADGYRRYYLHLARQTASGDVARQFAAIFPLPDAVASALDRQVQMVLDGI